LDCTGLKIFYEILAGFTKGLQEVIENIVSDEENILLLLSKLCQVKMSGSEYRTRYLQNGLSE
jgi:hypothetical protein